jgi:hypothetical protein
MRGPTHQTSGGTYFQVERLSYARGTDRFWYLSGADQDLKKNSEERCMSKKAAEHHKKAAEHHTHAARHHGEAAKHHESGQHEKAAHHAHTAGGHGSQARDHAEEARKAHTEEHGKK